MDNNGTIPMLARGAQGHARGVHPIEGARRAKATARGSQEIIRIIQKGKAKEESTMHQHRHLCHLSCHIQLECPSTPQQMMPPPLPPPMIDKGAGKAMNPPMMMPSMPTAPSGAMTSNTTAMPWGPQAQMMAFPTAPLPTSATSSLEPTSGYRSDGPAQQKLNRLLKEMKKEEDNLSPHLPGHCPRDAETRREEQYQELVICSQGIGRCQGKICSKQRMHEPSS